MGYIISANYFERHNKERRWLWRQEDEDSSQGCSEVKLATGPGKFVATRDNEAYRTENGLGCSIVAECEDVYPFLTSKELDNAVELELWPSRQSFAIKDTGSRVTVFKSLHLLEDGTIKAVI